MACMRTVVILSTVKPGEIFDAGTRQTQPGGREVFFDPYGAAVAVPNVCPVTLPAKT